MEARETASEKRRRLMQAKSKARRAMATGETSFGVFKEIGRVETGVESGFDNPHEAAFVAISRNDEPGTYSFQAVPGLLVTVQVTYQDLVQYPKDMP